MRPLWSWYDCSTILGLATKHATAALEPRDCPVLPETLRLLDLLASGGTPRCSMRG